MKKIIVFNICFVAMILIVCSCNENIQEQENTENNIDSLLNVQIKDNLILLDLMSSDFQSLIVSDAFGEKYNGNEILSLPNKVSIQLLIFTEDVDAQLKIVEGGSLPKECNFNITNIKVDDFNDLVSENFLFSNQLESLVFLKPLNYEDFLLNPKTYLLGKKFTALTSANFLLMQTIKEYKGIKTDRVDFE